jgi:hypothetical protein
VKLSSYERLVFIGDWVFLYTQFVNFLHWEWDVSLVEKLICYYRLAMVTLLVIVSCTSLVKILMINNIISIENGVYPELKKLCMHRKTRVNEIVCLWFLMSHVTWIRELSKLKGKVWKMESPLSSLRKLRILKYTVVLEIWIRG